MLAFAGLLIAFIVIVLFVSIIKSTRVEQYNEHEEYYNQLENEIQTKENQLQAMTKAIESQKIDKRVNLTQAQTDVLDIYEKSGIKIPADILEDLTAIHLTDEKEIFDYIENQRNYWKLENQKKPYKKVK